MTLDLILTVNIGGCSTFLVRSSKLLLLMNAEERVRYLVVDPFSALF